MSPFHFYLLLEELSTPPLNIKTLYKHNTTIAEISSLIFAVTFFLCRILYGTYIFVQGIPNLIPYLNVAYSDMRYVDMVHVAIQLTLFVATRILNFYWMSLITNKVYIALFSKRKRKKSFVQSVAVDEKQVDKLMRKDFNTYVGNLVANGHTTSNGSGIRSRSRKDD